jgi:hypothetical protein
LLVEVWAVAFAFSSTATLLGILMIASAESDDARAARLMLLGQAVLNVASAAMFIWLRKNRTRAGAWSKPLRLVVGVASVLTWGPLTMGCVSLAPIAMLLLLIPGIPLAVVAYRERRDRRFIAEHARRRSRPKKGSR